jgi:hypothetical protein
MKTLAENCTVSEEADLKSVNKTGRNGDDCGNATSARDVII